MGDPNLSAVDSNALGTRQQSALWEMISFVILASLAVICRFVSRKLKRAEIGADDYMIVVGLMFTWATFADSVVQICLGVGRHTSTVPKENLSQLWKAIFGITMVYASALTTIKFSILLFYRRLFIVPKFRIITSILGGIILIWWMAVVIVQMVQCRPIQAIWNKSIPATCIDGTLYYIGVAVPNITTDVVMLCLPVRMVWRLQTSLVHKVALTITFLTGGFVIFASLYRIAMLHEEIQTDPFWYYNDANIWTTLEPSIGVVSACLPTLRPLTQFVSLQFTRKPKDSQRGIQLDSFGTKAKGSKLSNQHTWIDDDLNFQPKNQASNKIAISSTKHEPDAERDERLLPGILVSQDVDVERASK